MSAQPRREEITGLLLAGGRGSRMGGIDKGLAPLRGRPLAAHVLERLAPQVGRVLISANRHLDDYRHLGHPVLSDADTDFAGPLAGLVAGLRVCTTPWLLVVPCDAPRLPTDLAARLAGGVGTAELALARSADGRLQPTFCLLRLTLADALAAALAGGERKLAAVLCAHPHAVLDFDRASDADAFFNANRPEELASLELDD